MVNPEAKRPSSRSQLFFARHPERAGRIQYGPNSLSAAIRPATSFATPGALNKRRARWSLATSGRQISPRRPAGRAVPLRLVAPESGVARVRRRGTASAAPRLVERARCQLVWRCPVIGGPRARTRLATSACRHGPTRLPSLRWPRAGRMATRSLGSHPKKTFLEKFAIFPQSR